VIGFVGKVFYMMFFSHLENEKRIDSRIINEVLQSKKSPISTLSGIVSSNGETENIYMFTTGHNIEVHHRINYYNVIKSV